MRVFSRGLTLTFALFLLPLAAEAQSAKEQLVGAWSGSIVLDAKKLSEQLAAEGTSPEKIEAAVNQAAERVRKVELELEYKADGTYAATFRHDQRARTEQGQWEVIGQKEQKVTVRSTSPRGEAERTETFTLELLDGDHIRLTQPDLEKANIKHFDFTRKKTESKAAQESAAGGESET